MFSRASTPELRRPTGAQGESRQPFDELGDLLTALRWGFIIVAGLVMASRQTIVDTQLYYGFGLVAFALFRTLKPLQQSTVRSVFIFDLVIEAVFPVVVVSQTGYWSSPFSVALIFPVIAWGFAYSWMGAFTSSAAIGLLTSALSYLFSGGDLRTAINWTVELLLVGALSGYARKLFVEANERATVAVSRVRQLSQANILLYELNQVAQTLPASLNFDEVVDTTTKRISELIPAERITLAIFDETTNTWELPARIGGELPERLRFEDLPPVLQDTVNNVSSGSILVRFPSFYSDSTASLLAPLVSRGALVGLLVLESTKPDSFTDNSMQIVSGYSEQAALALDNARWFERLRFVGADQERNRIARDLHDRVGQSLAYVGFELERLAKKTTDQASRDRVLQLREDVRAAVSQVRETLYDLRSEVSDQRDIVSLLQEFAERVEIRSNIAITLNIAPDVLRLPPAQEREMWLILQEAIINAERHGQCSEIQVSWRSDGVEATGEVQDNGVGFATGDGRQDSYGLAGMRERASAIGASLEIESTAGTKIRCKLTL